MREIDLTALCGIARLAGQAILDVARSDFAVAEKEDHSPVTAADTAYTPGEIERFADRARGHDGALAVRSVVRCGHVPPLLPETRTPRRGGCPGHRPAAGQARSQPDSIAAVAQRAGRPTLQGYIPPI